MKIVCDTAKLAKLCSNVQRTVSSKSTIPAIEGILLNALGDSLRLTGYDLEVGTETYLEADVDDSGSIILNAKNFCDILRLLPGETVSIESDERNICKIKSGETEYSIIGTSADEYPDLPTISGGFPIVIQQGMLKDMIRKTIFSVSVSERNPVHCGVKFEISEGKIVLVAVDGARLAIRREEIDYTGDPVSFVVPAKTLGEIVKLSEDDEQMYSISVGKRHISFEVGEYRIISRLLEGNFIDYKAAIPLSAATTVYAPTRRVIECVERTSLIITDRSSPVRCIISPDRLKFSSITSIGTATDKMEADVRGQELEIGFNSKFILDALKACETEEIKIEFNSANQPILILPTDGESFLFLVLPVRI
ncbi:MAG: DNA polymerase III subunit beta [Clostridia bacterium]|nr:DNA polymerase III subunit beta [Clostridia bacterium]